ncbi:Trp biosynthesis-associated membrane protein [Glutamicibacter creatinolyticus]|uniref:Trp biosynthesis-associated membrane protein n=1 Tax=Glutamicibacter creatinolyticus TaxID=162496 RepID=UPI003217D2A2
MMRKMLSLRNVALFGVVAAGLGLWAATRTWVLVDVQATTVQVPQIVVDGSQAAPAVTALCVVVLAAALALLIGGKVVRYVIGAISVLAGAGVISAGLNGALNPRGAAAGAVAEATGLKDIVADYQVSAWPMVVAVAGALIVLQGICVLLAAGHWSKTTKYDRVRSEAHPTGESPRNDRISDWEQLSAGDDPTESGR